MSNINDRVAYLKGLAEGMKLTDETNEGKLLLKMLDAMQDMAEEITALRKDHDELDEYVESIDDDLADLEDVLFGDEEDDEDDCDDDECGCGCHDHDHEHEHHHHHDEDDDECGCGCHEHDHHHHHHHADEVFTSWGKETAHPYGKQELAAALEALDTGDYGQVLRAKGIVAGTDGKWLHFDYVPGEVEIRNGAAGVTGRLCVIGAELKEDALTSLFHLN